MINILRVLVDKIDDRKSPTSNCVPCEIVLQKQRRYKDFLRLKILKAFFASRMAVQEIIVFLERRKSIQIRFGSS